MRLATKALNLMTRSGSFSRLCTVLLVVASLTRSQAMAQQAPIKGLDTYIEQAMKAWQVPGVAIAIVKDDSVVYTHGYGVRALGKSEPVDENTIFAIASPLPRIWPTITSAANGAKTSTAFR